MKKRILAIALGLTLLTVYSELNAQTGEIPVDEESNFTIEGTSPAHNWTVSVPNIQGKIQLNESFWGTGLPTIGTAIENLVLHIPVKDMDGGKALMNEKMHRALQEPDHPEIIYKLIDARIVSIDESESQIKLETKGNITVAGITKPVEMVVTGKKHADNHYEFTGSHPIKMSDFNIERPSFAFVKTGDEVVIFYSLIAKN